MWYYYVLTTLQHVMKTLIILSVIFLGSFWAVVEAQIDDNEERDRYSEQSRCREEIWRLQREIKMGPQPYTMLHPKLPRTKAQEDSILLYCSRMTRYELADIKASITENVALRRFIDTIIMFKDSLDLATKGYVGGSDE